MTGETTPPAFTILLPINRPPGMLPYAIRSVLAQDRQDFELFIICDGAPAETVACAEEFAASDPRIRVFAHPKGERHGEVYRHQALQHARGEFVCQLGDDDLWLPHHLAEMAMLLRDVDFGNLSQVEVDDDKPHFFEGDLADADAQQVICELPITFFGPTAAGYRLAAYRALPAGWSPAPPDVPTDIHMWRKFLAQKHLRFGTRIAVTSIRLAARTRPDWTMGQRSREMAAWAARLSLPEQRTALVEAALLTLSRGAFKHHMLANRMWQETEVYRTLEQQLRNDLNVRTNEIQELQRHLNIRDEHLIGQDSRLSEQAVAIKALQQKVRAQAATSARKAARLKALRATWSWRITRPFRWLARRLAGKPRR